MASKAKVVAAASPKKPRRLTDSQIRDHLAANSVYFQDGRPVSQAHIDAARSFMERVGRGTKVRHLGLPGEYD